MPRYVETTTDLPGFVVRVPDGASFMSAWAEIFDREIYKFQTSPIEPRILDCGANIGLSVLYFKRRFPKARITAFEADPKIFSFLRHNIGAAGLDSVELVPKAVWSAETQLQFQVEGADAGRIGEVIGQEVIQVSTVRLSDYLKEPIDFLKIDIEGAETEVLRDCVPFLGNVEKLFVEYHSFANQPQALSELLGILTHAGFRFHIHPVNISSSPFLKINEQLGMDLQLNIYAYRQLVAHS